MDMLEKNTKKSRKEYYKEYYAKNRGAIINRVCENQKVKQLEKTREIQKKKLEEDPNMYYCKYCDKYVKFKQSHDRGVKHKENFKVYYLEE